MLQIFILTMNEIVPSGRLRDETSRRHVNIMLNFPPVPMVAAKEYSLESIYALLLCAHEAWCHASTVESSISCN